MLVAVLDIIKVSMSKFCLDGSESFDPDNQNTELSYLWSVPSSIMFK